MLRAVGLILWTLSAVWFGTFLATEKVGGKTGVQHLSQIWQQSSGDEKVADLRQRVQETLEDARDSLAPGDGGAPRERHSERDRAEVNKLIAAKAKP